MSICYDVNGVQTDAIPCYNSSTPGACCEPGDECLSIGLCEPGPGKPNTGNTDYYRPTGCTDPHWQTDKCFSGCNSFGGNGLQACGNESYCCYDYNGCDCSATSLFDLGVATIVTSLAESSTTSPASASASISSPTLTPSASASPASQTSAVPTATSTHNGGNGSNSTALGAGLGAGLGVPLLLAVLASIYFFCIRKPKRQQREETPLYYDSKNELDGKEQRRLAELQSLPRREELDAQESNDLVLRGPPAELSS